MKNPFFKKKNNIYIGDIFNILKLKKPKNNFKVDNISDLNSAKTTDLSFFNSLKYIEGLKLTKANNIEILTISNLVGEAIKRISNSTSVSDLFN